MSPPVPRRNHHLFEAVQDWFGSNYPGWLPQKLIIKACNPRSGRRHRIKLPLEMFLQAPEPEPAEVARHSPDFRCVNWFGTNYTFTPLQAAIVKQLWEAWESGVPDVGGATLIENAGDDVEVNRVDQVFRNKPAWGTMIISTSKGTYRLCAPSSHLNN